MASQLARTRGCSTRTALVEIFIHPCEYLNIYYQELLVNNIACAYTYCILWRFTFVSEVWVLKWGVWFSFCAPPTPFVSSSMRLPSVQKVYLHVLESYFQNIWIWAHLLLMMWSRHQQESRISRNLEKYWPRSLPLARKNWIFILFLFSIFKILKKKFSFSSRFMRIWNINLVLFSI